MTSPAVVAVEVGALPCGWLKLPRKWLFAGLEDSEILDRTPDYAFYIHHKQLDRKIMFDLGFNKHLDHYSPALQNDVHLVCPEVPMDATDHLLAGGVSPNDIDSVVYSHMHWDHIGDIRLFKNAAVVVGPGATEAAYPGWPTRDGPYMSYALEPPSGRVRELSYDTDRWEAWGPFEKAHDFFGDGSFYLIDTPGHMPGHLSALARSGEDEWIFMGGDVCHARHFFSSCCGHGWDVGTTYGPGPTTSMHGKPSTARDSIGKVALAHRLDNVFVAIAHDPALEGIMPEWPRLVNGWRARGNKEACERKGRTLQPQK